MRFFNFLFKGLRGKLTLTYTLVTVLALFALEIILLFSGLIFTDLVNPSESQYVSDVTATLVPDARSYLQPELDLSGLQTWLDVLYRKGYASLEPQDMFDSPAAKIVAGSTIYVLDPNGKILAQTPRNANGGMDSEFRPYSQRAFNKGLAGAVNVWNLYTVDSAGNYYTVVPIYQEDHSLPVLGVIALTIEPVPVKNTTEWLTITGLIMLTALIMLVIMVPFGTLFGFIISSGLTKRLKNLARVTEDWGKGNFSVMPAVDRSNDEIGALSKSMRNMVERIRDLMQDKQTLAQMKERNRIAQELHDTVKQQNFATLMQVRAARNLISKDPAGAEKSLVEAENLIKSSQQELGVMISELRPPALEGKGLAEALKEYLDNWSSNACIPATIQVNGEAVLPIDVEQALYRVAQEALSNVARHSRASAVIVRLDLAQNHVKMEIVDNGIGFDALSPEIKGFGMISMRDRMVEVNGTLSFRAGAENGTVLMAEVPIVKNSGER